MNAGMLKQTLKPITVMLLAAYTFAAVFSPAAHAQNGSVERAHRATLTPQTPPPTTAIAPPRADANRPGVGPQRETFLFEFRHPESKEKIRVSAGHTPAEKLRKYSPKNTKKMSICSSGEHGIVREILEEVPLETLGFTLFTLVQSWFANAGDPGGLKRLYEENIEDPVVYASIVAFVTAFQGAKAAFKLSGLMFDPCKGRTRTQYAQFAGKNFWSDPPPPKPTRFQRNFFPFATAMSLGVGMGVSVFVGDILKDQDLMLCSKGLMLKVDKKLREEACDRAYEVWVMSRKINQYLPDIMSMMSSYFISAYLAMPALQYGAKAAAGTQAGQYVGRVVQTGLERYIPVVWRSVSIVTPAGARIFSMASPTMKIGLYLTNLGVMVAIQVNLAERTKAFWNTWSIHGRDIINTHRRLEHEIHRARQNNWAWAPEKKQCSYAPGSPHIMPADPNYPNCTDYKNGLPELIKLHAKRQAEWRNFLMEGPLASHQHWKDYVLRFHNTYTASYNFNKWFVESVALQNKNRKERNGLHVPLFYSLPLPDLDVLGHKDNDERPISLFRTGSIPDRRIVELEPVPDLGTFEPGPVPGLGIFELGASSASRIRKYEIVARLEILHRTWQQPNSKLNPPDRVTFARMIDGFRLINHDQPIAELNNPNSAIARAASGVPREERESAIAVYRLERISESLRLLNTTLESHPIWRIRKIPFPSGYHERMAQLNPFAAVKLILGNPESTAEGLEALRSFDNNPAWLDQDLKKYHPKLIGDRMHTPSMTDYLLGSMVCGPEADPSTPVIVKEMGRRSGTLRRAWQWLTGTGPDFRQNDVNMIEIEAVRESAKTPKPSWMNPDDELTLIHTKSLIDMRFYPPRLVKDLGRNVCRGVQPDQGVSSDQSRAAIPSRFLIHEGTWMIGGRKHQGFLDIAKHNLRPELFNADQTESKFEDWWAKNVDPAVERMANQNYQKFKTEILEDQFYPALTGEGISRYVRWGNKMNDAIWNHPMLTGVIPSINSEVKYYLDLVKLAATPDMKTSASKNALETKLAHVARLIHLTMAIFHRPDIGHKAIDEAEALLQIKNLPPFADAKINEKANRLDAVYIGLKDAITMTTDEIKAMALAGIPKAAQVHVPQNRKEKKVALNAQQTRFAIISTAVENIQGLAKETDFYLSLTKTVYLTRLYERNGDDISSLAAELEAEMAAEAAAAQR